MQALRKTAAAPGAALLETPRPAPGPHEVLVRVETAAVCGTDLHIYNWDAWAQARIHPPLTFGHEFCGTIEQVGSAVAESLGSAEQAEAAPHLRPGTFVSAEMHVACGHCFQCRTGQAHICQFVRILGVDGPGCFAEFVAVPAKNIIALPPTLSRDYAAILDPLGNAVHTVLAGDVAGRSVAVVGCGPIGLMAIAVARACGAGPILALEPNPFRRQLAERMRADIALDADAAELPALVRDRTLGGGFDVVLEFSGHPDGVRTALRIARPGARLSLLGLPTRPLEIDLARDVIFKGLTVQGINGRRMYDTWFQMRSLLQENRLNLDPLFTDRLPLSRYREGLERLRDGNASKVLLFPGS